MKNIKTGLVAITACIATAFAFKNIQGGSIRGSVNPPDGAVTVWALSSTDTVKTPVNSGNFELPNLRAGTYRVIIEAKPPYKNAAKEGVMVSEGGTTDVGQIILEK
jgi:hypothetical protein